MAKRITHLLSRLAARRAPVSEVVFRVAVPPNTPPGAAIYLAGSANRWTTDDPAYALRPDPTGGYSVAVPVGTGILEYKFCRGSWASIETDADNHAIPNRHFLFGHDASPVAVQVLNWEDLGGPVPPRHHSATAGVQVLALDFPVPQLHRRRRVWLYLPPDYGSSPERRYPVLYLQDGQNVFDEFTSFAGEWGVDETLDGLHAQGRDYGGCIVVAVDNGHRHRLSEYSPWPNPRSGRGGEGEQYVDFLVNTLKPHIDGRFRTLPDATHTGIGGSSMGGLISLVAALRYPGVFGRVGVFSPAFWFAGLALLPFIAQHPPTPTTRFYLLCGTHESASMEPLMAAVRDALLAAGLPPAQLSYHALPDGQHAEWFWRREFAGAYEWLFG